MKTTRVSRAALAVVLGITPHLALALIDSLTNLWPHAEGASWSYERIAAIWNDGSPQLTTGAILFELGAAEIQMNGDTLQSLAVQGASGDPAFWSQLRVARPDVDVPMQSAATSGVALHDAARLRFATNEIAAYATTGARAWVYFDTDAQAGRTFRLQLVPSLADSVSLSGTVVGTTGVSTPAGSFADAVRMRYVVDFGWGAIPGQPGDAVRAVTRGEIFFAPGVGPVLARETFVPAAATRGTPPPAAFDSTFTELQLVTYALTPTQVRETSWSAIKQRFR